MEPCLAMPHFRHGGVSGISKLRRGFAGSALTVAPCLFQAGNEFLDLPALLPPLRQRSGSAASPGAGTIVLPIRRKMSGGNGASWGTANGDLGEAHGMATSAKCR